MSRNSLAGLPGGVSKFEIVGPTVDDDVRRIVARYGADAVKEAVKKQTVAKRGRKPEMDWPDLRDVLDADARHWLDGGDPFASRSNYSIAKAFADRKPGHSHPGTMKRIERKLVKRRVWITLVLAESMSRTDYPHAAHIRTLEALSREDAHDVWASMLDRANMYVADYTAKKGEPPPAHFTMEEVENGASNALSALIALGSGNVMSLIDNSVVASDHGE